MLDKKKLIDWLESLQEAAKQDEDLAYSLYPETSQKPYAIVGGWDSGFDNLEDLTYHSKGDPSYAMSVKIIINDGPWAYADFEILDMPYNKETGDVDDTSIALEVDDNLEELATWLISEWERITKEYKDVEW